MSGIIAALTGVKVFEYDATAADPVLYDKLNGSCRFCSARALTDGDKFMYSLCGKHYEQHKAQAEPWAEILRRDKRLARWIAQDFKWNQPHDNVSMALNAQMVSAALAYRAPVTKFVVATTGDQHIMNHQFSIDNALFRCFDAAANAKQLSNPRDADSNTGPAIRDKLLRIVHNLRQTVAGMWLSRNGEFVLVRTSGAVSSVIERSDAFGVWKDYTLTPEEKSAREKWFAHLNGRVYRDRMPRRAVRAKPARAADDSKKNVVVPASPAWPSQRRNTPPTHAKPRAAGDAKVPAAPNARAKTPPRAGTKTPPRARTPPRQVLQQQQFQQVDQQQQQQQLDDGGAAAGSDDEVDDDHQHVHDAIAKGHPDVPPTIVSGKPPANERTSSQEMWTDTVYRLTKVVVPESVLTVSGYTRSFRRSAADVLRDATAEYTTAIDDFVHRLTDYGVLVSSDSGVLPRELLDIVSRYVVDWDAIYIRHSPSKQQLSDMCTFFGEEANWADTQPVERAAAAGWPTILQQSKEGVKGLSVKAATDETKTIASVAAAAAVSDSKSGGSGESELVVRPFGAWHRASDASGRLVRPFRTHHSSSQITPNPDLKRSGDGAYGDDSKAKIIKF